jgi:hypothetical protein
MNTRYVVLHHSGIDEPHFDLMFDTGPDGPLTTWRSPIWPIDRPTILQRLADHRREYLTYEGEVSDNRGRVDRVAEGRCDLEISDERWTVRLADAVLVLEHKGTDRWLASIAAPA